MNQEQFDTIEDFLNNEHFCEWILQQKHHQYWEKWQQENPEKKELIQTAIQFLRSFSPAPLQQNTPAIESALSAVWKTIDEKPISNPQNNKRPIWAKLIPLNRWHAAASVLLLICAGFLVSQSLRSEMQTYRTQYGETKTVVLPDLSTVILQANSQLKVPKNWEIDEDRVVKLSGQAYFDVQKINTSSPVKFTVQTSQFAVEVLGTQFDILFREKNQRVILAEGAIRMTISPKESINLKPNEMVSYSSADKKYLKQAVTASHYTSWTSGKITLNNTKLVELTNLLADNYGFQVEFEPGVDQSETRTSLSAIPITQADDLIRLIQESFDLQVERNSTKIRITKP